MTYETSDRTQHTVTLREALNRLGEVLSRPILPPPQLTADVYETSDGTAYIVEVPLPGLTAHEIRIQASGDIITLEVQPRAVPEGQARTYLTQELRRETTARVFTFPTPIDVDNVRARLEHGMLRIQVPKAEGAPSRVIPVESLSSAE